MQSQLLIGAVHSGSGKTMLTLGLLRAFRNRGLSVQSFKSGPDYIDTKFHELASGNPAVNLDLFLSSENHVKELYKKYTISCDVAVTEGVMGLFDGYDKMQGSSAQIAETLDIPVVLMVNAKSMAYSVAPLLYGFKHFSEKIHVAGVIFNMVGSESHYTFLKEACEDVGLSPLGYLPKNKELEIPSRHLGLNMDQEYLLDEFADKAASFVEQCVDLDRLLALTQKEMQSYPEENKNLPVHTFSLKSAVALDPAFNFMYHENIEYLKKRGTVTFFTPLNDRELPEADFVYLPGGYPELYLRELSCNASMKDSIRRYVEQGGRLLAECGGMMYLSSSIMDDKGNEYPMIGIFEQKASMQNRKLTLGYRRFEYNGLQMRGHEFHYSTIESDLESVTKQYSARNKPVATRLLRYKNAIAGYTHLYWAETGELIELFNN
jgi:cobyrinic acid a,c-diamide synthase